jgi:ABC-type sugar transport system permease subunit
VMRRPPQTGIGPPYLRIASSSETLSDAAPRAPDSKLQPLAKSRKDRTSLLGYAFLLPALFVMGFVYIYAIVRVVDFSLHNRGLGPWVGMKNYFNLVADPVFWISLRNNASLFCLIPVLIFLSLVLASLLYEKFAGWKLYRVFIFLPYAIPVVVAGLALGFILETAGLVNQLLRMVGLRFLALNWLGDSHVALLTVGGVILWRELGFGIILFLARMTQLSVELYESARLDGAGWWNTLTHITVPQLSTIIAFYVGVMVIQLFSWVFNYIFVLTRGGPGFSTYVSEYYIYQRAFNYDDMGSASAFSVVILVLVLAGTYMYFGWLRRREAHEEGGSPF